MPYPINFDYDIDDCPKPFSKEWLQPIWDALERRRQNPNDYRLPEFTVVRSIEDWDFLDGRWSWPKQNKADDPQP